jgi:homoserine dehydrogenase
MAVDVPVALLGYGNVGSAVARLLAESADDIERATGHRLRIVRALVRDPQRERAQVADDGVLTTDFASIRDDPEIGLVAELMGGLDPTGDYVLELLRAGKPEEALVVDESTRALSSQFSAFERTNGLVSCPYG